MVSSSSANNLANLIYLQPFYNDFLNISWNVSPVLNLYIRDLNRTFEGVRFLVNMYAYSPKTN